MKIAEIVLDIETCPTNLEGYFEKTDEEKAKLLNAMDSRIVAIGTRYNGESITRLALEPAEEKAILNDFWRWVEGVRRSPEISGTTYVGFNIAEFDISFLVTRSFINDIKIYPLILKENLIDLRQKIVAYKGCARGRLKELSEIIGLETLPMDGSDVAELVRDRNYPAIKEYLLKDLELTEAMHERCRRLRILEIERW